MCDTCQGVLTKTVGNMFTVWTCLGLVVKMLRRSVANWKEQIYDSEGSCYHIYLFT